MQITKLRFRINQFWTLSKIETRQQAQIYGTCLLFLLNVLCHDPKTRKSYSFLIVSFSLSSIIDSKVGQLVYKAQKNVKQNYIQLFMNTSEGF